ncbi:hypothetical protein BY458DRAFT_543685 [Sporodiniella umbellata]|nr:hypothetical protein BY458DRAFT_543685 [Sporodiniella umbellata]
MPYRKKSWLCAYITFFVSMPVALKPQLKNNAWFYTTHDHVMYCIVCTCCRRMMISSMQKRIGGRRERGVWWAFRQYAPLKSSALAEKKHGLEKDKTKVQPLETLMGFVLMYWHFLVLKRLLPKEIMPPNFPNKRHLIAQVTQQPALPSNIV